MRYRAACTKAASASHKKKEAIGGCSIRVLNAVAVPKRKPKETGSICMPDVAIYSAGFRNTKQITAR
ncbi:transcriptional antitermination N peptide [Edwardsiella piscicida]|uniref:transcriptional antitermination N peptide n=1 Tax=Edwardsiella piscicida TaxID=1263550 RepID=UPI003FA3A6EB